jgi:hypothetical protein
MHASHAHHGHPAQDAHHAHHAHHAPHAGPVVTPTVTPGLTRTAFFATLHCLLGCAVGEMLGLVIGTAQGWGNVETTLLAVVLAFAFGYAFTVVPLRRQGLGWGAAARLALAADTASIAVMELVDNAVMWSLPGAMDATVTSARFWGAMALSFAVALLAAWPLNRWLLARGRGHALVHGHHGAHAH